MAALPRLIVITDPGLARDRLLEQLSRVVPLGPEVAIQVRWPGAPIRQFAALAEAVLALCAPRKVPVFLNGRFDLAVALGTHLHLPSHGAMPRECRTLLQGRWISVAVHNLVEVDAAAGADLALVSPVFSPHSKPNDDRAPLGEAGFRALAERLTCPAYALGGVDRERIQALRPPGAATIGAVLAADDPWGAARDLIEAFPAARPRAILSR